MGFRVPGGDAYLDEVGSPVPTGDGLPVLLDKEQTGVVLPGSGPASPELLGWLTAHATPVFTASGPTNGDTVVWRLDHAALRAALRAGVSLPPVDGGYA